MLTALILLLSTPGTQGGFRPIIVLQPAVPHAALLGGSIGSRWIKSEDARALVIQGQKYRLYGDSAKPTESVGGKAAAVDDTGALFVKLNPVPAIKKTAVGITGSWAAAPRSLLIVTPRVTTIKRAVRQYLRERNMPGAIIRIKQAFRGDLNGDGRLEFVVVAERYGSKDTVPDEAKPGDYSVVLLIAESGGKRRTHRLASEVYPPIKPAVEPAPPNVREAVGILDLNGDGRMEIVVQWQYYEGGGFDVYTFDGIRPRRVLEWSAGL